MITKVFTNKECVEALQDLTDSYRIFVPVKEGDFYNFRPLEKGMNIDFEYQNSRLSPKSIIYPQSEGMFECDRDTNNEETGILNEIEKEYPKQAVVGIRPCDAQAFHIVKRNFDNQEYQDPWWVKRFESTVLIGLGCNEPCSTCFCTSVNSGPFDEKYLDVMLYKMDEKFLAKTITDKGEKFIKKTTQGSPADDAILKEAEKLAETASKKITSSVKTDKLHEKTVNDLFNAPFWEEIAFSCINCGTCTYLCPTCWCFDIQDETSGNQVLRLRNWDSCMSPLFTLEGSGHNPRSEKYQRVRQRFMHKLKYYVDKYENGIQCSGCGRCVRYCPVNIDIRHVAELMNNFSK
jgi:sulfhydrogenase subunit beta (sulfur reductase)